MVKFALPTILLLSFATSVNAQSTLTIPHCFKQVAPLAKRLGVRPSDVPTLVVMGCDGKNYDVLAMMNALLDRMEQVSRSAKAGK